MIQKLVVLWPFVTLLAFIITFHVKPQIKTYLLFVIIMLPLMEAKVVPEYMGGYKTFDVITVYCVFFFIKRFIQVSNNNNIDNYFILFSFLLVTLLMGSLFSEFRNNSFQKLIKVFPIFIYTRFFIIECNDNPTFLNVTIKALRIAFFTSLAFMFIQLFAGIEFNMYGPLNPNTYDPASNLTRYPGIFTDSQANGQFLSIGCFLFLYKGKNSKMNLYRYMLFLLMVVGLILAGSRSPFVGFASGVLIIILLGDRIYRTYALTLIPLFLLCFWFFSVSNGIFSRASNINEDYLFRESIWKNAIKISTQHPVVGIGIGNYQPYIMRYEQDQYLILRDDEILYLSQPENGYLRILVEAGYIGFIIFLLFILSPIIEALYANRRNSGNNLTVILVAGLVSWMFAYNTVDTFFDNRIMILVITLLTMLIVHNRNPTFANESVK